MSIRATSWVLHESPASGNDRLVLIAIADEADDAGRNAFPGVDLIARKARVHRATAIRAISRLEAGGELLVKRPDVAGRGRHNRYVVVMGRDPIILASSLGWARPALDDDVAAEWSQSATLPHTVDNSPVGEEKVAQWSQNGPEKVAPNATRPLDPKTQGDSSPSVGDNRPPRRRRGLDPTPANAALERTAAAQLAHIRAQPDPPPPVAFDPAVADAIRSTRALFGRRGA